MSDLEKQLRRFPTLEAPDRVWERIRRRAHPRRRYFKEAIMSTAAAGLLAWLALALMWTPTPPPERGPAHSQDGAEWLDREPAETDLPPNDRIVIEALLVDLGSDSPARREAAEKLLEARLDPAIPLLRKAATSDNLAVQTSASTLIRRWEEGRRRVPLLRLLAEARQEAKPGEDYSDLARRAVEGDADAVGKIRKIGWPAAGAVADAAGKATVAAQLRVRRLLQDLLLPRLHGLPQALTLQLRAKNAQTYGDSAYSFRYATGDADAVKNNIDLVYNPCGLIHFTPYGGTQTFVVDAGKLPLDQVTTMPKQGWRQASCIQPRLGHVYIVDIHAGGETYAYRFLVKALTAGSIGLEWAPIGEPRQAPPMNPLQGKNGIFGTCGGNHQEY
jgi:hypothetical protein